MAKITDSLPRLTEHKLHETTIRYMEIFRFDGNSAEQDIPWNDKSTNYGLFKISCSGASGYAEYALPDTREYAESCALVICVYAIKGTDSGRGHKHCSEAAVGSGPHDAGGVRSKGSFSESDPV
ncbi:MAG: hypothetical protein ACQEXX_05515 [Bacillota bacterium]